MPRRPYTDKPTKPPPAAAATAVADIAAMANKVEKTQRLIPNNRTNGQSMRECDGAESQERFHEATDVPKDRFSSNNKNASNDDSFHWNRATKNGARQAPCNDNERSNAVRPNTANSPAKNHGKNRPEYDNRRYNEQSKSVDNNDNWTVDGGDSANGSHNINVDVSSKGTEKGEKGLPKYAPDVYSESKTASKDRPSPGRTASPPPAMATTPASPSPKTASIPQSPAEATVQMSPKIATVPQSPVKAASPAPSAPAPLPGTTKPSLATTTTTAAAVAPVANNIGMEVDVHANATVETDPMASVTEQNSTTDAMSIDSSLPVNVTQSTAEMVSMTKSLAVDDNDNNVAMKSRELAFITHVDNPNRFYAQMESHTAAIDALHKSLQIVAPQLPPLRAFRAGELCVGKFSLDGCWYRAKIIDTDGEITSIQFIDYGNTDSITDNALLKVPDHTLMAREPFAMACSLPIAPHGTPKTEWAEKACEKLRTISDDTPLQFELVRKYKDVNYIKVYSVSGRDLMREFIQEELADPLEIIESGETCYISHINSLNDFYIQVGSDTDVLHKIELHLDQNRESPIVAAPTVGQICSAQYEDGQFYRARILDILAESYHVEFLDYGNEFVTTEIRILDPRIAQIPYLRKRCQLQMPKEVQEWSKQAEQWFRDTYNDGATAFKVHLMKPGKTACVELVMDDGAELSTVLGELCEKRPASPNHLIDEHDPFEASVLNDIMEEATMMSQ